MGSAVLIPVAARVEKAKQKPKQKPNQRVKAA